MAVKVVTDQNFEDILNSGDTNVVKYFADWCGSCRLIGPKFIKLSDQAEFSGVLFSEINAENNPEARKFAGVTNLPFFAIIKNGQLIEADFTAKIDSVAELIKKNLK